MIVHVKLKNSEDLVAHVVDESNEWIILKEPVCFCVDPTNGIFAKDWLMHASLKEVQIYKSDIYIISQANRDAIKFYNQFKNRHSKKTIVSNNELESIFVAMLEAKESIKH